MHWITRYKGFFSSLVKLAIPVALQNLITFSVNFADNIMISSLGDAAVSGVFMANQMQTLLQMTSGGIEGALLILAAQYWGKRDIGSIKRIAAIGLQFSVIFGTLLTLICLLVPKTLIGIFSTTDSVINAGAEYLRIVCLSYVCFCITQALIAAMRSIEVARIGMHVSILSLVVNVGLNYALIFGKLGMPAMGIRGAAIATVISRLAEMMVMILYIARIDKVLKLKFADLLVSDTVLRKDFIRNGLPILGGNIVWSVNLMASSAILGRFSESVTSAV